MKQRSRFAECRVEIPALNALAPITESIAPTGPSKPAWNALNPLIPHKNFAAEKYCFDTKQI